jgi:hypothetical protein
MEGFSHGMDCITKLDFLGLYHSTLGRADRICSQIDLG